MTKKTLYQEGNVPKSIINFIVFNKIKGKNPHLNRCRKALNDIRYSCIIRTISKLRIEGNFFNMIKSIDENPTASSIQNGEIFNAFFLRPGIKQGCTYTITIYIQQCTRCHTQHNNSRKKLKNLSTGKEKAKLPRFTCNTIV